MTWVVPSRSADLCPDDGTCFAGSCDACERPERVCECTPGEFMIKRCDACDGEDCGATCVGA